MTKNKNIIYTNVFNNGLVLGGEHGLISQGYTEEQARNHPDYWLNKVAPDPGSAKLNVGTVEQDSSNESGTSKKKGIVATNQYAGGLVLGSEYGLLSQGYSEEQARNHPAYWKNVSNNNGDQAVNADNQILAPTETTDTRGLEAVLLTDAAQQISGYVNKSGVLMLPDEVSVMRSKD